MASFLVKNTKDTVRSMVREQYKEIANSAAKLKGSSIMPAEGWVRTIRKALDMSGAQLASRLNLSRNRISIPSSRQQPLINPNNLLTSRASELSKSHLININYNLKL